MKQDNRSQPPLRPYAAPKLRLYGSVLALTAGGTGMVSEANLPSSDPFKDLARQKCEQGLPFTAHQDYKHCR